MANYGTEDGFEAYREARGYAALAGDPVAALVIGSDYIDATYGMRFPGEPTGGIDQERAWPRIGASVYGSTLASNVIPQRVINATYEAAYLHMKKPGSLSISFDPAKKVKRQKVEGLEREFFEPGAGDFYAPNAPVSSLIEGILAPLIGPAVALPAILVV